MLMFAGQILYCKAIFLCLIILSTWSVTKIPWKKQKKETFHTQAKIKRIKPTVSSISVLEEMDNKLF